ncbi:right-handed parallel beta-helix repeat-containing protein [Colwellia psychrerythraea]|uniref:Right handed beta helix domain-containing protein n=1 Tax=Colwellia psychrerythraea TaxID=28229 RepID=A0A099KVD8_COLPS|nr:hypothetical protein [Colwellia psychrerythraea]KGJ94704.1 hypothetical protein ND2E_1893 [Colwellia psychrerythraea]
MMKKLIGYVGRYFYVMGVVAHWLLAICLVLGIFIGSYIYNQYDLPADIFMKRVVSSLENTSSPLFQKLAQPVSYIAEHFISSEDFSVPHVVLSQKLIGASFENSKITAIDTELDERVITHHRRLVSQNYLRKIHVSTAKDFINAIKDAEAGDNIILSPGQYNINYSRVYLSAFGQTSYPIRISAEAFGDVSINLNSFEGFLITGDNWIVENLKITGVCAKHSGCEHAFHLAGSKNIVIRNNEIVDFNSSIKVNSSGKIPNRRYPDHILIESNSIYNTSARETHSSVTLVDIVAGNDSIMRKNYIGDNSKLGGDFTSYAAFLKGNGNNGLVENNIVNCESSVINDNSTRIGLSFGGGGTGPSFCRDGNCDSEHSNGVMRNNLILNCSQDVGIYLNRARNSTISHNSLFNTLGIDVRFKASSVKLFNNLSNGPIRSRDGGKIEVLLNNESEFDGNIKTIKKVKSEVSRDLCGMKRNRFSNVGALTMPCLEQVRMKSH